VGGIVLQTRCLGQTGITISCLGLGTVKFGRNQAVKYPDPFDLPSDKALVNLLSLAKQQGINLLDTAPAYGLSEQRLGALLKGQRSDWVISTKVGETFNAGQSYFDFSAAALLKSIEQSLKNLKTDYLDIVLVHSDGNDEALIKEQEVFASLALAKQQGKLRAFGMSTKTKKGARLTIEQADVVMLSFNPAYQDEREMISLAKEKNSGVLIKKALASGHLHNFGPNYSAAAALHFAVNEPGVSSVIVGTINPLHLEELCSSLCLK
jgi:aryl-alcohol dehydrogenase-like predicted oxidoreductase